MLKEIVNEYSYLEKDCHVTEIKESSAGRVMISRHQSKKLHFIDIKS